MRRTTRLGCFALSLTLAAPVPALVVDPSFEESPYATVVTDASLTSMAFAPDGSGRLFVTRKQGEIYVIQDGVTVPEPFAVVSPTYTASECGLLGIAFDPDFLTNAFVYVFVTVSDSEQRILRYRADGNVGRDETVILGDLPTRGYNHDGGALAFGPDGKLYFAIGDLSYDVGHNEDLTSLGSKLGRVNRDGSVPADNPFVDGPGPNHDLIYARGLRNPFSMTFQPATGLPWVNVVGTNWEQVFVLGPGDHGGYGAYEGNQPPGFVTPVIRYETNGPEIGGCITGGTFLDSSSVSAEYRDDFFFGDFNTGRITRAHVSGATVSSLEAFGELRRVVDMAVGPDGDLYYASHASTGQVMRARFKPAEQALVVTPRHPFLVEGGAGAVHVRLARAPVAPVTVRVQRTSGDADVTVTTGASLTFDATSWDEPQLARLGALLDEDVTDDTATLTVSASGISSETVSVRVRDEWTGELPGGGEGGEAGVGSGGEIGVGGELGFGGEVGAGVGGVGGVGGRAGVGGRGLGGNDVSGGVAGEAGDGAMGTAGSRAGGGRAGAGGVTGGGGAAASARSDGGCGCSTAPRRAGASLGLFVALGLIAGARRRTRAFAW